MTADPINRGRCPRPTQALMATLLWVDWLWLWLWLGRLQDSTSGLQDPDGKVLRPPSTLTGSQDLTPTPPPRPLERKLWTWAQTVPEGSLALLGAGGLAGEGEGPSLFVSAPSAFPSSWKCSGLQVVGWGAVGGVPLRLPLPPMTLLAGAESRSAHAWGFG